MITKELVDFIRVQKSTGKPNEEIKTLLVRSGWLALDIDEAFLTAVPPYAPPVSNGLKDSYTMSKLNIVS